MSQSIDVLDQRTKKDLKFVETMEVQLKNLENKFKEVEDGHETNVARQYKVQTTLCCFFICFIQTAFIADAKTSL